MIDSQADQAEVEQSEAPAVESLEDRVARQFGAPDLPAEEAPEEELETVDEDSDEVDPEDESQNPEYVAIQIDGEEYQVPPALEQAFMKSKDYTEKTQQLSETRQKLDLQTKQHLQGELQQTFMSSVQEEVNQLQQVEYQLGQYKALDWAQLSVEDMQMARVQMDNLKDTHNELKNLLQTKQNEWTQDYTLKQQEYIAEGTKFLKKAINGYSEDVKQSILEYAVNEGYTETEVTASLDPRYIHTLWKAQQYDKLRANKGKAVKKAPTPQVKAQASQPVPAKAKQDLKYQKKIAAMKKSGATSSQIARTIHDRLAEKF